MSAALDYYAGGESAYTGEMPGDVDDNAAMQPWAIQAVNGPTTWWEGLIAYGATKAIDNRFAAPVTTGNVQPGSYAGANGKTYLNNPQAAPYGGEVGGVPVLLLVAGAALVYALAG